MGGLVSRYYTSNDKYLQEKNNIRKIIFISTPHNGTAIATIGAGYVNNTAINDLGISSNLVTSILPSSYNQGLNNHLQVGNLIALNDEVVSEQNASLIKWGIDTQLFNVGQNSLNVDNIISGNIVKAPNHNNILNNTRVIDEVVSMLKKDLPYPNKLKD